VNANQSKALIEASKQALALLDPSWPAFLQLKRAITQATAKIPPKSKKIPSGGYPFQPWNDGNGFQDEDDFQLYCLYTEARLRYIKGIEPEPARPDVSGYNPKEALAAFPRYEKAREIQSIDTLDIESRDPRQAHREAELDQLNHCACSHISTRHREDERGNLLECADCDCDHFHYQARTALVKQAA